jgi:hypothetical protein
VVKRADWDLDFEADAFEVCKAGCPCPVPWCAAHVLRHVQCGDADGAFDGLHGARVRRFRHGRWRTQAFREVARVTGVPATPDEAMIWQTLQDGQNTGVIPTGIETSEQARQRRSRKRLGME